MRSICLCFQVHQPVRLKKFRFFEIGNSDYYYDDFNNEMIIRRVAENCYLPSNKIILDLINKYQGRFRVSFSISGTAIDQFKIYAPEVIESFRELAATGCVEFLAETYSHSLAVMKNKDNFKKQVESHSNEIETLFGNRPTVFANTGLIYSDEIGAIVADMGYKATLAEGPGHILKWRSPNYLYRNAINPALAVLLKNHRLSDDIASRFSNPDSSGCPLTAKKYVSWLNKIPKEEKIVNLFMDYETFGERQKKDTGIFEFLSLLPSVVFTKSDFDFMTPSEVVAHYETISTINMPSSNSWADKERDMTAWLGNELQQEAFGQLYGLNKMIDQCTDPNLLKDWQYLQTSDHFYYMSTKYFSDGDVHACFNPYDSPYEAFINYMNVLNDFTIRINRNVEKIHLDSEIKGKVLARA
jgi:alpha-amylase